MPGGAAGVYDGPESLCNARVLDVTCLFHGGGPVNLEGWKFG